MSALSIAINEWRNLLGNEYVISDSESIREAETATFQTNHAIPVILHPADSHQVQQVVKIAARYKIALYPIGCGKNWGLGSRVPAQNGCALLDLGRMKRIVDYNPDLSYITVEPGVTFQQVSDFLRGRKEQLFLPVIGGPPTSSLIGNALERGDGVGPLGERIAHACSLEVVLGSGALIRTGFSRFDRTNLDGIARWGLGPSLDSLFSQSNLGIVTRMTFWLMEKPACLQTFIVALDSDAKLAAALKVFRRLQAQGILAPNSLAVWNNYKLIASEMQYPWDLTGGQTPLKPEILTKIKSPWSKQAWVCVGALYAPSREHARADRRLMRRRIKPFATRILFIDDTKVRLALALKPLIQRLAGIDVADLLKTMHSESVFLGYPTQRSLRSTYWRKRTPIPATMDPDRDGCGVIWICPAVPFDGGHITRATRIMTTGSLAAGFEPQIAFVFPSPRLAYMFLALVYDRSVAGEDERAMACHDSILAQLTAAGYQPYRLGIHSMAAGFTADGDYAALMKRLKVELDPQGILAPGRYEFG